MILTLKARLSRCLPLRLIQAVVARLSPVTISDCRKQLI